MTRLTWMITAAASLVLAGCGGGDGGGSDAGADPVLAVPNSAVVSPRAYAEFVGSLAPVDIAEGLSVTGVVPPLSEADDAIKVL